MNRDEKMQLLQSIGIHGLIALQKVIEASDEELPELVEAAINAEDKQRSES